MWVIWVVLQQVFGVFLIASSGLWSNLETNACKSCIQTWTFVVTFCLYVTFLLWWEQLWSLIQWPASCSRRERHSASASCVKSFSKLLIPKIQVSSATAHTINDLFSWPASCKHALYKPRHGKHHTNVFFDFFVLLIWWFGWTLLKSPIKKGSAWKCLSHEIWNNLNCHKPEISSTYQRCPGPEQRITWFLSQGMQNAVSQCWAGSESLIQWASVPDKMSGREVTGQGVFLGIENLESLFPQEISKGNLCGLCFSMGDEWCHWIILVILMVGAIWVGERESKRG